MNPLDALDGQKTRIAGWLTAAFAFNEVLISFGQPHLTQPQTAALIGLAAAMGIFGIGSKLTKLHAATVAAGDQAATATAVASDKAAVEPARFNPPTHPHDPERVLPWPGGKP